MKKSILILLTSIISYSSVCQSVFRSPSYNYSIEIPANFTKKSPVGANVDSYYLDSKGSSIVVVVKSIEKQFENVYLTSISQASTADLQQVLSENLNNVIVIKKGLTFIGKNRAFYTRYTFTNSNNQDKLYTISYDVVKNGHVFIITATCANDLIDSFEAVFFRSIQSFNI